MKKFLSYPSFFVSLFEEGKKFPVGCDKYSRTPVTQTLKGNKKQFELVGNSSYPSLGYQNSSVGGIGIKTEVPQLSCLLLLESLSSEHSWGHGRQEGCARSGSSMAFVARKAKIKQWLVFGIMRVMDVLLSCRVMDVLSVKCLHSWHSISNFRKIFVAEGLKGTRTFYLPHFHVNISSFTFTRQAWNAIGYYLIL